MPSFRDTLDARADGSLQAKDDQVIDDEIMDDLQAMKEAFYTAVTPRDAYPYPYPEDPRVASRIRRSVPACAVRGDAQRRPVYNQQIEHVRLRLLDDQRPQRQSQQVWWMGATAAACLVGILICAYQLLKPAPTAAVVEDKHAKTGRTAAKTVASVKAVASVKTTADARPTASAAAPSAGVSNDAPKPGAAPVAPGGSTGSVIADRFQPAPRAVPADRPHNAAFYKESAIGSYRIGDFPGAIANLDTAIRLDPSDAQAYDIRGNAADEIGAFDSALADYDEAIRLDPRNPVFFLDRAVLRHGKGNLDEALIDLDRAVRFSFSDPNLYCYRGLVWYEKGSHARAIADFDRAVNLDQDFAAACISRGLLLHRNGEIGVEFANLGKPVHVSTSVFDVSRKPKN